MIPFHYQQSCKFQQTNTEIHHLLCWRLINGVITLWNSQWNICQCHSLWILHSNALLVPFTVISNSVIWSKTPCMCPLNMCKHSWPHSLFISLKRGLLLIVIDFSSLPWNQRTPVGWLAEAILSLFFTSSFFVLFSSFVPFFISICGYHNAFRTMFHARCIDIENLIKNNRNRNYYKVKKLIGEMIEFHNLVKRWQIWCVSFEWIDTWPGLIFTDSSIILHTCSVHLFWFNWSVQWWSWPVQFFKWIW